MTQVERGAPLFHERQRRRLWVNETLHGCFDGQSVQRHIETRTLRVLGGSDAVTPCRGAAWLRDQSSAPLTSRTPPATPILKVDEANTLSLPQANSVTLDESLEVLDDPKEDFKVYLTDEKRRVLRRARRGWTSSIATPTPARTHEPDRLKPSLLNLPLIIDLNTNPSSGFALEDLWIRVVSLPLLRLLALPQVAYPISEWTARRA